MHDQAYYEKQRRALLRKFGVDLSEDNLWRGTYASKKKHPSPQNKYWNGGLNAEYGDELDPFAPPLQAGAKVMTWRDKHRRTIAFSVVGTNNYMVRACLCFSRCSEASIDFVFVVCIGT